MMQNMINSWIRDCRCKYQMNHDRKKQDKKHGIIAYSLIAVILSFIILCFVGCKCPCSVIPSGGTHNRDSVRTEYVHDSVTIDRWHKEYIKGDTVFIHDSVWRDRWRNKYDSIYINNTDTIYQTIEVEKKGSAFWKGSGIALWCLIGALVIGVIIGIIIKFAK